MAILHNINIKTFNYIAAFVIVYIFLNEFIVQISSNGVMVGGGGGGWGV